MVEFTLDEEIYQAIVDGTLSGYLQYLDERSQKQQSMNVSGAYAWTRGNHIDDQVSKIAQEKGLTFEIQKAGYTWEYLQFSLNEADEKYMLIVKNAKRVEKSLQEQKLVRNKHNYLSEKAECNRIPLQSRITPYKPQAVQLELELMNPDEIKAVHDQKPIKVNETFARFYIVTYEIDESTKLISSIKLTMPNPETMNLDLVDDLTYLIQESDYEINLENVAPIQDEITSDYSIYSGDSDAFGYAIPEQDKAENE